MSAAASATPGVQGFVEAVTPNAVLGWAWVPGQSAPLTVELRLGATVVAEAAADQPRDDLARNGVGDGRHAFSVPVPEAARSRLHELRVLARTAEGAAIPLGAPPPEDTVAERLATLSRGMEALAGSQRVLHRNVQAALLAQREAPAPDLSPIASAQAALSESIAALELFVVRIEAGLAALAPAPTPAAPRPLLAATVAVATASLLVSVWALIRVMPG